MIKKLIVFLQAGLFAIVLAVTSGCSSSSHMHAQQAYHMNQAAPEINVAAAPRRIALLLPTTGPLSPYATAIRNGFFTAFYTQKKRLGYTPTITVYDTNGKNINGVYQMAVAQGADFIVGPLEKSSVEVLANDHSLSVPVLALNTTPAPPVNHRMIEFALSPTDEAKQAAIKAAQDLHHNAIVLAPHNAWGQRLANAFTQQWNASGGTVVATQFYRGMSTLAKNIRAVLQVQDDTHIDHGSKNVVGKKIKQIPQHRQDFDMIFLVATSGMAKEVQPMLRFYFVDNVPIYSTSQVYSPNESNDRDLDGILFCDMPWILSPAQMQDYLRSMQQQIQTLWPNHYHRLAKFYAMGVDAFDLTLKNNQLHAHAVIPGATGALSLSSHQTIDRQLQWARMDDGVPRKV